MVIGGRGVEEGVLRDRDAERMNVKWGRPKR